MILILKYLVFLSFATKIITKPAIVQHFPWIGNCLQRACTKRRGFCWISWTCNELMLATNSWAASVKCKWQRWGNIKVCFKEVCLFIRIQDVFCAEYILWVYMTVSYIIMGHRSYSDCVKRYQNVNSIRLINKFNRPMRMFWAWLKPSSKSLQCAWLVKK